MKYKTEDIIRALIASHGILAAAARTLGCDRNTIYNRMKQDPDVRAAYDEANEINLDFAESKLMKVMNNDQHKDQFSALRYYLRTKGKRRGYGENMDVTSGDKPIEGLRVIIERPDDD